MIIEKVAIKNFRLLKSFELDLKDGLSLQRVTQKSK